VPGTIVTAVAGAVAIVIVLLLIPVVVIMSGAVASAILGEVLYRDGVARNEGSELLELDD
jgi:hypothetical protein